MKNILKLMMIISIGLMLFQSCQEGDISMPELGSGAALIPSSAANSASINKRSAYVINLIGAFPNALLPPNVPSSTGYRFKEG